MSNPRYQIKQASDSSWFYTLVAANGETLTSSETYTRKADAIRAAEDARKVAGEAEIDAADA
jgi:uncharacterized protein YegP (UPF0339 family)